MKRGLTNPLRPWAAGGGKLGAIRWFAATDVIPGGWEPCDGGAFERPGDYRPLIAAMNMSPALWASRFAGVFYWRSNTGDTWPLWGRASLIFRDKLVWGRSSGGSGGRIQKAPATMNPANAPDSEKRAFLVSGALAAFSVDRDGNMLVTTQSSEIWGANILLHTGDAYIDRLAVLGFALVIEPVLFKGRYFSATATALRRCLGAGSWGTWTDITPAGMGAVVDLVAGQVAGAEVLAAFCANGQIWVSSDGDAFAALPAAAPNPIATRAAGRSVYDGAGTWYSVRGVAQAGFQIYRSADLAAWEGVAHPVTNLRAATAGGGVIAVAGTGAAISTDKGGSWTTIVTTSTLPADTIATNGGFIVSQHGDTTDQFAAFIETAQHKPSIASVAKAGVTYSAYMRVR